MTFAIALLLAAAAPPPPEIRAEVAALLGAIDRPVSAASFRRFGPDGETALADIALSSDLPFRRARALEVLATLRSPSAEEVHRTVVASGAPRAVRRAAVLGLGALLPADRAPGVLRPLLEGDRDARVRAAAAEALARSAPSAGCSAVRAQVAREDPAGRPAFRRALATCALATR